MPEGGGLAFTERFHERGKGVLCAAPSYRWAVEKRGRRKVVVLCLGLPCDSGLGVVGLCRVLHVYGRGEGEVV